MMKLEIGYTKETAEVSSPLLVYIDLLALLKFYMRRLCVVW